MKIQLYILLVFVLFTTLGAWAEPCTPESFVSSAAYLSPNYDVVDSGALSGCFSTGVGKYIRFSKGNLAYKDGTWSFVDHQWEYGSFFGYGTAANPEQWSTKTEDYPAYEDIRQTQYDWGWANPIANGGNVTHRWYTPGWEEISYIFEQRPNFDKLYGFATVGGVFGIVILPDDWSGKELSSVRDYLANPFTDQEWNKMERMGAVFFPAAGFKWWSGSAFNIQDVGVAGCYWLSTREYDITYKRYYTRNLLFYNKKLDPHDNFASPQCGSSVREVKKVDTFTPSPAYYPKSDNDYLFCKVDSCAGGYVQISDNGHHVYTLTAIANEGYIFYQWEHDGSASAQIANIRNLSSPTTYKAIFTPGIRVLFDDGVRRDTINLLPACATIETRPEATPREGSTFLGWSTSPEGPIDITFPYTPTENITLYAVYQINQVIIHTDTTKTSDLNITPGQASAMSLIIHDGAKVTVTETNPSSQLTFDSIIIEAGGKLVIPSGTYIGANVLIANGGDLSGYGYAYRYPQLIANGTLSVGSGTIYYDYLLNNTQPYTLSLPKDVQIANITFANGSPAQLGQDYFIEYYDGAQRTTGQSGWNMLPNTATQLNTGTGYTIFTGNSLYQRLRLPMSIGAAFTETTQQVPVSSFPSQTGKDNDAGWNLVGNPYLATYGDVEGLVNNGIGLLVLQNDGTYKWQGTQRYVVIPSANGQTYTSQLASQARILPYNNFFVQIGDGDALSFVLANRDQHVHERFLSANPSEEWMTGLILTQNEGKKSQDYVGIVIGQNYTDQYEINADLQKLGHNSGVNVYGWMQQEELAFVAVNPALAMNISIGFIASGTGNYTFSIDESYSNAGIESVILYDSELHTSIDLQNQSYSFTANQGQNNTRFSLAVYLQNMPTSLHTTPANAMTRKYIVNGQLMINVSGIEYTILGDRAK